MDVLPFLTSLKLAIPVVLILITICAPCARILAGRSGIISRLLESILYLPMVLPPTVLGFYMLAAFSPLSPIGKFLDQTFGLRLLFTYQGLIIFCTLSCLPFLLSPLTAAFRRLDRKQTEASLLLGKGRLQTFFRVELPQVFPSLISATVLAFLHCIGEFGLVLMVGGSIPGQTRTASIAIFELVETMQYGQAHLYAGLITVTGFLSLFLINLFLREKQNQ